MTSGWVRWSGRLLAAAGSVVAAVLVVNAGTSPDPVYWAVESYPIALSLLLVGAGVLLARGRLIADRFLGRLLAWMVLGVVALSLLTGYLYSLTVVFAGNELLDTPVGVITICTFGALVGLLVGIYDVRNLEQQRAVERLSQVNNTLRIATGEVVEHTERDALERAVCERMAESDAYEGAWVGEYDADADRVRPVTWAGLDDTFVQSLVASAGAGPAGERASSRAVQSREAQFLTDATVGQGEHGSEGHGGGSMAVVPIVGANAVYALLGIYATRPSVFDEGERDVFTGLGQTVGQAVDSIQAHERLERHERELVEHNERLDRFASVVSHDLRNPLNVILGHVELLRPRDDESHIDTIARAGHRMEEILEDLLTLSRAGLAVDDSEPVVLASVARSSWENVATDGNELDLCVPDTRTVEADPARLMNVFENLFRNAVEHNDDPVRIRVGTIESVAGVNDGTSFDGFYVEDDGAGVPAEERDTVFDHGYTTDTSGTGLGLSIVEEIVEAHDWTVSAAESPDGGARFEVRTTGGSPHRSDD